MKKYDILIIGGGPSGLTAAIYAARAGKKILVFERNIIGGQVSSTPKLENYPGFKSIAGYELSNLMLEQALELGAEVCYENVLSVKLDDKIKIITTENDSYSSVAVILSMGATSKQLGLENEQNLLGSGLSYCATCDGAFFNKKDVAVVGGGNSAINDVSYLSPIANKVYLVYQNKFSNVTKNKLKQYANVELVESASVAKLFGMPLSGINIVNSKGEESFLNVNGLFVAIGFMPQSFLVVDKVILDEKGYIVTDENMKTNIDGVFAVGDIRSKLFRQIVTAASDGATAAHFACKLA